MSYSLEKASLEVGRSISFFRMKSKKELEYILSLGKGNLVKGYYLYEEEKQDINIVLTEALYSKFNGNQGAYARWLVKEGFYKSYPSAFDRIGRFYELRALNFTHLEKYKQIVEKLKELEDVYNIR